MCGSKLTPLGQSLALLQVPWVNFGERHMLMFVLTYRIKVGLISMCFHGWKNTSRANASRHVSFHIRCERILCPIIQSAFKLQPSKPARSTCSCTINARFWKQQKAEVNFCREAGSSELGGGADESSASRQPAAPDCVSALKTCSWQWLKSITSTRLKLCYFLTQ